MTHDDHDAPDAADDTSGGGYGDPPRHGRFQKGRSGNPRGRPKASRNRKTIVAEIAAEMHTSGGDPKCRRSTLELVLLVLRDFATQGNVRAIRACHACIAKYRPEDVQQAHGNLIVPGPMPLDVWEAKMAEHRENMRRLEKESRRAQEAGKPDPTGPKPGNRSRP